MSGRTFKRIKEGDPTVARKLGKKGSKGGLLPRLQSRKGDLKAGQPCPTCGKKA